MRREHMKKGMLLHNNDMNEINSLLTELGCKREYVNYMHNWERAGEIWNYIDVYVEYDKDNMVKSIAFVLVTYEPENMRLINIRQIPKYEWLQKAKEKFSSLISPELKFPDMSKVIPMVDVCVDRDNPDLVETVIISFADRDFTNFQYSHYWEYINCKKYNTDEELQKSLESAGYNCEKWDDYLSAKDRVIVKINGRYFLAHKAMHFCIGGGLDEIKDIFTDDVEYYQ